jgi:2'-5' RNA ligase
MQSDPNGTRPQSLYALVMYLPDPLGGFLDDLRLEMVPGCNPHAHISVLPPRPLPLAPEAAIEEARGIVAGFAPFDIELGRIEKFDVTDVIYISVEAGAEQLRQIHRSLNRGPLAFEEPFAYHPHVTLAQEIEADQVETLVALAARRWREFRGPRRFRADSTVFVRNTRGNLWIDLANGPLRGAPVGPPGLC